MLVSLHLHGRSAGEVADEVLCPAMRRVGDLWHMGELSVAQEHLATGTALAVLQAWRSALEGAGPRGELFAVCCSVEEDFHELPMRITALTLEAQGWDVLELGTSTPFYALAEAVERFTPRLVCVASTVINQLDRAVRDYGDFCAAVGRAGASVVLGGAGFAPQGMRRRFPADLHAESFSQLEAFALTIAKTGEGEYVGGCGEEIRGGAGEA